MKPIVLLGDMMLGRLVDAVSLPHPIDFEVEGNTNITSLGLHLRRKLGVPDSNTAGIDDDYFFDRIFGDTLPIIRNAGISLGNLECCITTKNTQKWPEKSFHYRMHPKNVDVLKHANLDFVCLANNHILDYGISGANDTINALESMNIMHAGYGKNKNEAEKPVFFEKTDVGSSLSRVMITSFADHGCGLYEKMEPWASKEDTPGINYVDVCNLSRNDMDEFANHLCRVKTSSRSTFSIVSCHIGPNWSWEISPERRQFAKSLVDAGDVNLIHGHSSHHIQGIEFIDGVPVIYGCGAFVDDYAIDSQFKNNLSFIYEFHPEMPLLSVYLYPIRILKMRVQRIDSFEDPDFLWLEATMSKLCHQLGSKVNLVILDGLPGLIVNPINCKK